MPENETPLRVYEVLSEKYEYTEEYIEGFARRETTRFWALIVARSRNQAKHLAIKEINKEMGANYEWIQPMSIRLWPYNGPLFDVEIVPECNDHSVWDAYERILEVENEAWWAKQPQGWDDPRRTGDWFELGYPDSVPIWYPYLGVA